MKPLTVAILAGGLTHEREVSLSSGRRVAGALGENGIQVKVLDVDASLMQRLDALNPDIVWPLVHGSTGEDGSLQDLLDLMGLPYVGTQPHGCRLSSSKPVAGSALQQHGINIPPSTCLPQSLFREVGVGPVLDMLGSKYGFPLVVKPANGGSALGLSIVNSAAELPGAMVDCYFYGEEAHVEKFIEGRELSVAVADFGDGPHALEVIEIEVEGPYDYDARYNPGRVQYFVPARLDDDVREKIESVAVAVHNSLGLRHLSRTDLILDNDGNAWFIDVNTAPGMTETSIYPQAVASYARKKGISANQVYADILMAAARDAGIVSDGGAEE